MRNWHGVIYLLTNTVNGKRYVGKTARYNGVDTDLPRWDGHIDASQCVCPSTPIHRAIKRYGPQKFTAEVIQHCTTAETLNAAEIRWIKKLQTSTGDAEPGGYNLTLGGDGVACTETVRERMRESARRRANTPAGKENLRRAAAIAAQPENAARRVAAQRATKGTEAYKCKAAAATRTYFEAHPETRVRIANSMRAYAARPETRQSLADRARAQWQNLEYREKQRATVRSRFTPEVRKRISEKTRALWVLKKSGLNSPPRSTTVGASNK